MIYTNTAGPGWSYRPFGRYICYTRIHDPLGLTVSRWLTTRISIGFWNGGL